MTRRARGVPRTQQWNVGIQRQLYARGVIDVGYVGAAGDNLIQPVDINMVNPDNIQNVCSVATTATSCAASTGSFGQITGARAPREIQLGLRFSWN